MFQEATNEATYYLRRWGIETVVQATSSGALIRFSYRVSTPTRAKSSTTRESSPISIDEKNGLAPPVPTVENVGQLRQVAIVTTKASKD